MAKLTELTAAADVADADTLYIVRGGADRRATVGQVRAGLAPVSHIHSADQIGDSTAAGRALLTAADATAQRGALNVADGANNYTHPDHTGDVASSGDGATVIANGVVTDAKLARMPQGAIKGRASGAGDGDPANLTAAQVRAIINVADGATSNATDAALRDRATHTGEQPIDTVTGLQAALDAKAALATGILVFDAGGDINAARPAGAAVVYWLGVAAQPANAAPADFWFEAS